jgi:uncharacterized protein YndB with AHSA1/START domain
MPDSRFVYVTYIRATPQRVWEALTTPEFMKRYFFGAVFDTDWKPGAPWRMVHADGSVSDAGEVIEFQPAKRLVLSWRNELQPDMAAEGHGRCIMDVEASGEATRLTITHTMDTPESRTIAAVSEGWPRILSNLKSLLETGQAVA